MGFRKSISSQLATATELRLELLDATSGIDEALLACEEWMTGTTDTDAQVVNRRTGLVDSAAGALNGGFLVLGMNFGLHGYKRGMRQMGSIESGKRSDGRRY